MRREAKPWRELSAAERKQALDRAHAAAHVIAVRHGSRMENTMRKMYRLPDGTKGPLDLPVKSVGYEMSEEQLGSFLTRAPSHEDKLGFDTFANELIKTKISYAGPFAPLMDTS